MGETNATHTDRVHTARQSILGQRERALAVARQSPPGSVGAAIAGPLGPTTAFAGNACAGDIGDYYESHRSMLARPSTRANIEAFTNSETAHFQGQKDCSNFVGGLLSAKDRADLVEASAQGRNGFAMVGQVFGNKTSDLWNATVRGSQILGQQIGKGWNALSQAVGGFFGGGSKK